MRDLEVRREVPIPQVYNLLTVELEASWERQCPAAPHHLGF